MKSRAAVKCSTPAKWKCESTGELANWLANSFRVYPLPPELWHEYNGIKVCETEQKSLWQALSKHLNQALGEFTCT